MISAKCSSPSTQVDRLTPTLSPLTDPFTSLSKTKSSSGSHSQSSLLHSHKSGIMSALGHTAYLDQSTIIKQVCSSQGSYCVNHLWIDYPVGWAVGWAPGGGLLAKHSMLYYAILNCGSTFYI